MDGCLPPSEGNLGCQGRIVPALDTLGEGEGRFMPRSGRGGCARGHSQQAPPATSMAVVSVAVGPAGRQTRPAQSIPLARGEAGEGRHWHARACRFARVGFASVLHFVNVIWAVKCHLMSFFPGCFQQRLLQKRGRDLPANPRRQTSLVLLQEHFSAKDLETFCPAQCIPQRELCYLKQKLDQQVPT